MIDFYYRHERVDGPIARSTLPAFGLKKLAGHQSGKVICGFLMFHRNLSSVYSYQLINFSFLTGREDNFDGRVILFTGNEISKGFLHIGMTEWATGGWATWESVRLL